MHKGRGDWQGRTSTSDRSHAAIPIRRFDAVKMRQNARVQENATLHGHITVGVTSRCCSRRRVFSTVTRGWAAKSHGCEGVPVVDGMQPAPSKGAHDHHDRGQGSSVAVLAVSCCSSDKVAFGRR